MSLGALLFGALLALAAIAVLVELILRRNRRRPGLAQMFGGRDFDRDPGPELGTEALDMTRLDAQMREAARGNAITPVGARKGWSTVSLATQRDYESFFVPERARRRKPSEETR